MIYHTQLCNSIGNQYQSMKDVYIFYNGEKVASDF